MEKFSLSDYGIEKSLPQGENLRKSIRKMCRLGIATSLAAFGLFAVNTAGANDSTTNVCHDNPYDVSCPVIDPCDPYTQNCPPPSLEGGGSPGDPTIYWTIPNSSSNPYPNVGCNAPEAERKAHGLSDISTYLSTYPLFYISWRDTVEIMFADGLVRQYSYEAEGNAYDPPHSLSNESACRQPSGQAPWTYENIAP